MRIRFSYHVADCYYNVTDLPAGGSFRFRVACVNKAGQGPYSNLSDVVTLDPTAYFLTADVRSSCDISFYPSFSSCFHSSDYRVLSHSRDDFPSRSDSAQPDTSSTGRGQSQYPYWTDYPIRAAYTFWTQDPTGQTWGGIFTPGSSTETLHLYGGESKVRLFHEAPIYVGKFAPNIIKPCWLCLSGINMMSFSHRGRFGVIRECRENATGNLFMAKIVPYEVDTKQAVLQEYDILKSLHHDRIMALHEAYVTPRYLVLISEYCNLISCFLVTLRFRYSEDDVVTYIVQILQGLDYLHARRILHLDIKPENIIVTHMNLIKIIDFGSAQTYNPLFLKQFSPPIGTLEYMCKRFVCVQYSMFYAQYSGDTISYAYLPGIFIRLWLLFLWFQSSIRPFQNEVVFSFAKLPNADLWIIR
ncbi:hypothetical protein XENOCAPTIV_026561 [Xenoophorus captivus]|uniref:Protein kinase domain-containing protein n=1 Tax=Xenoophorus captivus TaxID=1517983 RepID=A0ABV0RNN7_9TELE